MLEESRMSVLLIKMLILACMLILFLDMDAMLIIIVNELQAREGVKIEHEKKLATLQSQEYKGDEIKLDKTKTSIKKLQSLIIVTSQAVNTTSSAIVGLRDSDLIPQLVELCHG